MPERHALVRWVREFQQRGSVPGAPRRVRGSRVRGCTAGCSAHTPHLGEAVECKDGDEPGSRVHRILRQQLRLYPYKMQLTQRLHRGDKAKWLRFCRWILGKWGNPSFRRSLLFSDEAHFYLNGQVLKQNCRVWGE